VVERGQEVVDHGTDSPARDAINWTLNEVAEHLGHADPGFTAPPTRT
jgi:hypothetical protein